MKLLALLLLSCPTGLLPAASSPAAPSAPAQADRYQEFLGKFRTAASNSAHEELARLVRQYGDQALMHIDYLTARVIDGTNAEVEKEFETLRRAWKATYNNPFADKMYEYGSLLALEPVKRRERIQALRAFNELIGRFDKTRTGSRSVDEFKLHGQEFRQLAGIFESVGDRYFAGRCWNGYGICYSEESLKKDADLSKVYEGYGKAIEHFDAVEFRMTLYTTTREVYERLKAERFSGGAEPTAAPAAEPTPAGAPLVVSLQFEALADLEKIERPNYHHDDLYQIWPQVQLGDVGSSAVLSSAQGISPRITRVAPSKIAIDGDLDGTNEAEVPITGNQTLVKARIGNGDLQREWAFLFRTGIEQDTFQGLKVNLGAGKEYMSLFCVGAGSIVGTVGETRVRVIDDNVDGVYGSKPLLWNYNGLQPDVLQPDIDSIVVGESKRARPWSDLSRIGDAWYKLEVEPNGKLLRATPMSVESGILRLESKGLKPEWVVVRGKGGLEMCFFDLAADPKKGVEVPAGDYELCFGIVRQGKKQQTMKALILPGDTRTWSVAAGKTAVLELGAPYRLTFDHSISGDKLTVNGKSVTVRGVGGERYERIYNSVLRPEVSFRKKGKKSGGKPERMPVVLDMDELDESGRRKHSFADLWRPLDLTLEVPSGEALEVQLVEKKNKLFGALESDWK